MTDQERLDEIDKLNDEATNLTAGLKANGRPEKKSPVGSDGTESGAGSSSS